MGSYASIYFRRKNGDYTFVTMFNHKFFGYIDDEEAAQLPSVKYLIERDPTLSVEVLNCSYIGTVAKMTEREARIFMDIYADDFKKMFPNIEDPILWDKWPKWKHMTQKEFYLSFD